MPDVRLIDLDLLKRKVEAMQACEPHYAYNFLNDALNPSTEWGCIEDMIDSIPVIDAQPLKHGRWIETRRHRDADGYIVTDYRCSECGIMLRDTNHDDIDSELYCYHCGAKNGGDAK